MELLKCRVVSHIASCRSLHTSHACLRRRSTRPHPWYIPERIKYRQDYISPENQQFLSQCIREIALEQREKRAGTADSPVVTQPKADWERRTKRPGIICKKIGVVPMWMEEDGRRILCTMLQVLDNHVIKYIPPQQWSLYSKRGQKEGRGVYGCLVVGADYLDPRSLTVGFRNLFMDAGVLPMRKLAAFLVSPDAALEPGTSLTINHLQVGQWVDIASRTIGHGFQGVMKRWGFKGGTSDERGNTKTHRRPGAIGTQGDGYVRRGKRMPGHMGNEMRWVRGTQIVRINYDHNVLYLNGCNVPGPIGRYVLVRDTCVPKKRIDGLPEPTFIPGIHENGVFEGDFSIPELWTPDKPSLSFDSFKLDKPIVDRKAVKKQAKAKR